jgi:HTH-type transcriptional repressor of NAD biosynthesis genes
MYKTGVYFLKGLPPHRGHLNTIIEASTKCDKLYVVLSDNKHMTSRLCEDAGIKTIPARLRVQWLCQELQDIGHVKVLLLDESDIPEPPHGWEMWTLKLRGLVPDFIDVFFVGEKEYVLYLKSYFPSSACELFDPERTRYPVSATMVRSDPMKYWDYILGSARPWFAKKVLVVGTESCGKTTLVKYLAKIYHTSWSEEAGRYYAQKYLGGNESIFTDEDFTRIAHLQYEQDYHALRTANKVAFFDTDAVVTQYYSELYMGHRNPAIDIYINPDRYDLVIMLTPDVRWVNDGQRLNGEQEQRLILHKRLKSMYEEYGFGDKIVEVSGDYNQRLHKAIELVDDLIK